MFWFRLQAMRPQTASHARQASRRRRIALESLEPRLVAAVNVLDLQMPVLHSNAGAPATVYLDFTGDVQTWSTKDKPNGAGGFIQYAAVNSAFDLDNDLSSFNSAELTQINQIWQAVSEDFAPFNIDVTTADPGGWATPDGRLLRVVIGGSSNDWFMAPKDGWTSGYSSIGSFTDTFPNTVYVWTDDIRTKIANGVGNTAPIPVSKLPLAAADTASHEAGHAFGLQHQGLFSTYSGALRTPYNPGYREWPQATETAGWSPLMGDNLETDRTTWHDGPIGAFIVGFVGSTPLVAPIMQPDMEVLASSRNGFGFRADEANNTFSTATYITTTGIGIINSTSDVDYFAFKTKLGMIDVSVLPAAFGGNLDARLELLDYYGNVMTSSAPTDSFGARIQWPVGSGTYRLAVRSQGRYGDVGQYTVSVVTGVGVTSTSTGTSGGFGATSDPWAGSTSSGGAGGSLDYVSLSTLGLDQSQRLETNQSRTPTDPGAGPSQFVLGQQHPSSSQGSNVVDVGLHHIATAGMSLQPVPRRRGRATAADYALTEEFFRQVGQSAHDSVFAAWSKLDNARSLSANG